MAIKQIFDVVLAIVGIILFLPLLFIISLLIVFDSRGSVIYQQHRVGRNMKDFVLYKFRTMYVHQADQKLLTVGSHDARITHIGYWLRKYKLDELPQLFNILIGDMSFVGPRPEVRKYVELYSAEQKMVLTVKPGITDWASIEFCNENDLLEKSDDPETFYIKEIIPLKLDQSLRYIRNHTILIDIKIIFITLKRVIIN
ncbi:sugar transferase [Pedobacter sp. B4-66]|uniref:sugar transferase n=1 Tax=Pedobacter sp. B4-66 TaxID=2817280 RepID=UPI001BD93644|nr:sugar transferase [Pedobacter sp. B4-66]